MKFHGCIIVNENKINCRPATGTIFEIIQDIININGLTKFREEWTIHVTLRVKNDPPPGGYVFQPTGTISNSTKIYDDRTINVTSRVLTRTIFKLVQDTIRTNLLTKFNGDQAINVASSVLTMQMLSIVVGELVVVVVVVEVVVEEVNVWKL
ncbi:hypothetical protein DPMN_023762 [Dreissena polymorpha]|uniref:Uncharacterized protein n=1 Tax=Dreissena polymorpha TaxID=45954 RepID=A0A9D4LN41_DREPO|nr:hypothetical protein DPMN_023762 [Dreissena polymorpha]